MDEIRQALDELVESGTERGVQVAVYRHGDLVVDAAAGLADPATGHRVTATSFGMAGAGGSFAYADPATGIAFALTKNRLTGDFTAFERLAGRVGQQQ